MKLKFQLKFYYIELEEYYLGFNSVTAAVLSVILNKEECPTRSIRKE